MQIERRTKHAEKPRATSNGLLPGLAIAVAIGAASAAGAFTSLNGKVLDAFTRLAGAEPARERSVLLVAVEPDRLRQTEDVWLDLVRRLRELGARQTAFSFLPAGVSDRFYAEAARQGALVFGRALEDAGGSSMLEPVPPGASEAGVTFGAVTTPPVANGLCRQEATRVAVDGGALPTLAAAVSERATGRKLPAQVERFFVDLSGSAAVPQVSLDRALAGGLIPELVRGRTVLVGLARTPHALGIPSPMRGAQPMSLLEFRGLAIETLIRGRLVREAPAGLTLLAIALVVMAGIALSALLERRAFAWVTAAAALAFGAGSWALFSIAGVLAPAAEILAAYAVTLLAIYRQRALLAERSVKAILLELSAKLRQRVVPESFFTSPEHWAQVTAMVDQTLHLSRSIFLERVPEDHRVREVKALGCSIDDIRERRRDYERAPYSTALAAGGPLRLDPLHRFMSPASGPEWQYLVPLTFGGQPLGFWAFGVDPSAAGRTPRFDATIRELGKQIGELLYRRRERLALESDARPAIASALDLSRDLPHEELERAIGLLERRLSTVETLFAELGTAAILYDLFGRVLLVNRRMTETLGKSGIAPYELAALDLAVALTGRSADVLRGCIQRAILDRDETALPAVRLDPSGRAFLLRIRPMAAPVERQLVTEACPFGLCGVVLELDDVTEVVRHARRRERFVDQVVADLDRLLTPVISAAAAVASPQREPQARERALDELRAAAAASRRSLERVSSAIRRAARADAAAGPVDALVSLRAAAGLVGEQATERGVKLTLRVPDACGSVLGEPDQLRDSFRTLLDYLIGDSVRDGAVEVAVREDEHSVRFSLRNSGFGIPDETFQRYLRTADAEAGPLRQLRATAHHVVGWGGELRARSDVGVGTRFALALKKAS